MTLEKEDLVRLAYRQSDTIDQLTHENDDLKLEIVALKARLALLDGPEDHVIELRADFNWVIQHPLACRPNLFDCEVNQAALREDAFPDWAPGRYVCELDEAGELRVLRVTG